MSIDTEAAFGASRSTRPATITFMGEDAGFRNTFGMYKIAEDGTIYDVEIIFANASGVGSGGDLIAGASTVEIDAEAGDQLGFFIMSNGYGHNRNKQVFEADSYELRDWGGGSGNIYEDTALRLFAIDSETGDATLVRSHWNSATWHMHHDPVTGIDMNVDNFDHVRGELMSDGTVVVGFEDLRGGGDQDFDDVMFSIDLGDSGAEIVDAGIYDGTDQQEEGWESGAGEAAKASVTFLSETAGYQNTIGMYKIADDGTITDVSILFANASKYDSGGDLIAGESSVEIDVTSGDKLGFFVLPNAYARNWDKVLFEGERYVLRNPDGDIGNVYGDQDLSLFYVHPETGVEIVVEAEFGNATYHMTHDAAAGISLNDDGLDHAVGEVRDDNTVLIGFEDLRYNGDWDFDDVVIKVDLSSTGATVGDQNLKTDSDADQGKVGWLFEANDDVFDIQPWDGQNDRLDAGGASGWVDGLNGADLIYGDRKANMLRGNDGDDVLLGEDGDDVLEGGDGRDELNGGAGADGLYGGADSDRLWGFAGEDSLSGGDGADKLWGGGNNDDLDGGSGDDRLYGNDGADILVGGLGADLLVGGSGADVFVFTSRQLDGSVDTIHDIALTGAGQDSIDLQDLDLLASGQSRSDWLTANASDGASGITLDIGDGEIVLANMAPLAEVLVDLENVLVF